MQSARDKTLTHLIETVETKAVIKFVWHVSGKNWFETFRHGNGNNLVFTMKNCIYLEIRGRKSIIYITTGLFL